MNENNVVIFKGTKDGISLQLNADVEFDIIVEQLSKKIQRASKFFEGADSPVIIRGRNLSKEEEKIIMDIVVQKTSLSISFLKIEGADAEIRSLKTDSKYFKLSDEHKTKFRRGNIRSGQSLTFEGSVVIIGDINPGGVVKARGNIIVLGDLKGMAHAGYGGNREAFIMAVTMVPVQLRIADIITRFPEEEIKKQNKSAEYAYIYEGQIYVAPLKHNHKNLTTF